MLNAWARRIVPVAGAIWVAVFTGATGLEAQTTSAPLDISLRVQEPEIVDRDGDLAWASVPLPPGRLFSTENLIVRNADGRQIPAQLEPLGRWWHLDDSIAWLGLEFPVQLVRGGETTVRLMERTADDLEPPLALEGELTLTREGSDLVIDTGAIEVTLKPGELLPFAEVRLDANRDGDTPENERVILGSPEGGVTLHDARGRVYRASAEDIVIERSGPLHAIVKVTGVHRPIESGGFEELLDFVARFHFTRGNSIVRLEWTLKNARLEEPWGAVPFRSYQMVIPGSLGFDGLDYYFASHKYQGLLTPATLALAASPNAVALFQYPPFGDSKKKPKASGPTTKSGNIIAKLAGRPRVVHRGTTARGAVLAAGKRFGFGTGIRDLWQNHPKMLGWGARGRLEIGLWPDWGDDERMHTLEDQTQKTHEVWFDFFERQGDLSRQFQSQAARFEPLERQVRGLPSIETIVASRAWGDLGDLSAVPDGTKDGPIRFAGRLLAAHRQRQELPRGSGWQHHAATDPLGRSDRNDLRPRFPLFGAWLQTASPAFFELAALRARHTRDLRPFHLAGFRAADLASDAEPVIGGALGKRFGRDKLSRELADLQENLPTSQQPYYGNVAFGADLEEVEHLVQHWWLTGERASLEAVEEIGEQLLTRWEARPDPIPANLPFDPRRSGWLLRALGFAYQATGNDAYLEGAKRVAERARRHQDPRLGFFGEVQGADHLGGVEQPVTENWGAGVLARGLVLIHRLTGDDDIRDMIEGLASFWVEEAWAPQACRGQGAFRVESLTREPSPPHYRGLPREEWLLPGLVGAFRITSQVRFRDRLIAALPRLFRDWQSQEPAILVDWFQAALVERSRYEVIRKRPDLERLPRIVEDLKAERGAAGVTLTWTAPRDAAERPAARYQLKLASAPIVPFLRMRDRSDSVPFWSLPNRFEPPTPAAPGQTERVELAIDLEPGVYFFALRWEDQRGRWSGITESARVEILR